MIAPSVAGQFPGNLYQLKTAIMKTGFFDVYEVAQGADITTYHETKEFLKLYMYIEFANIQLKRYNIITKKPLYQYSCIYEIINDKTINISNKRV